MNHYPSGFNDLVFRRLFGSPENKDLLIDFLNAIFAHSGSPLIQDVDYLDPYQPSERLESKDSILDLLVKDAQGRFLNVEVQLAPHMAYVERSLFYWSKVYSRQLQRSGKYEGLNPTIGIHLIGFPLEGDADLHGIYRITKVGEPQTLLTQHLELHYINFQRLKNEPITDILKTKLCRWLYYLDHLGDRRERIMQEFSEDHPLFIKVDQEYRKMVSDEHWEHYLLRVQLKNMDTAQMFQDATDKGLKAGREQGREEGRHQAKVELAKNLLREDLPLVKIADLTELTVEEIQSLQ
jgi:predicted transposase/invertase (TIGR01784 family)